jgi:prolyl oligopeptidase
LNVYFFLLLSILINGCSQIKTKKDPHQWLEAIDDPKALEWVKNHNEIALHKLEGDSRYPKTYKTVEKIILAKDRLPNIQIINGVIYNFWQDEKHIRGILRRTSLRSYQKKNPNWETVLDLDQLSKIENENWVYKNRQCLPPEFELCLLSLSRGGKDATVTREFNLKTKTFIPQGFYLPEAKTHVSWKDKDHLWVGTDFGEGSLTDSGYPRIIKIWKRGQTINQAQTIFEGQKKDMVVSGFTHFGENSDHLHLIQQNVSFFESKYFVFKDFKLTQLEVPESADLMSIHENKLIFMLQKDWKYQESMFETGSVISYNFHLNNKPEVKLIMKNLSNGSIQQIISLSNTLFISTLEDVTSRLYSAQFIDNQWMTNKLKIESLSSVYLSNPAEGAKQGIIQIESFLNPASQFLLTSQSELKKIKQAPKKFNSNHYEAHQYFVKSKDGTKIPYFLLHKKGLKLNGKNPTLLYGYGGFLISMTPTYPAVLARTWLDQGGVYALANIRGGGEYGPLWHQAALKTKRQNAYDDFIAVAENLIEKKITTKNHLAIMGGSNGGLLMGVMYNQRPDLWKAVICQVPLLDMLRFDQLLAGASWVGEYGSPKNDDERKFLASISPYHNLNPQLNHPKIFISTSTKDDRVHPGHARKMVAKLEENKKDFLYYENIEGGHSAAANLLQRVAKITREYVFLYQQLIDP